MTDLNTEINDEIKNLHEKNSADWESLSRQVDQQYKEIKYNPLQRLAKMSVAPTLGLLAARRVGKTTIATGRMTEVVNAMPRSLNVLACTTYEQAVSIIIPAFVKGLELHGYYKDLHYFIGRKAPKRWGWKECYEPPMDYHRSIHFFNGTTYKIVAVNQFGSGQGGSCDSVIGDEVAQYKKQNFDTEIGATLSGTRKDVFYGNRYFLSKMLMSTMPLTQIGDWFFELSEKAGIERDPRNKSRSLINFLKATSFINKENIPEEWYISQLSEMMDYEYKALILNKRINHANKPFYPNLSEYHYYSSSNLITFDYLRPISTTCVNDTDLERSNELILGLDFGVGINSLVVAQLQGKFRKNQTLRFLKDFYALSPKITDDLLTEFDEYYSPHKQYNKKVTLCYDATGNVNQINQRKSVASQCVKLLRGLGWKVQTLSKLSTNPEHEKKYFRWIQLLNENDDTLPRIRFNQERCKRLIFAMEKTEAKRSAKGLIQKDKSSERRLKGADAVKATHGPDAADYLMYSLLDSLFRKFGSIGGHL